MTLQGISNLSHYYKKYKLTYGVQRDKYVSLPLNNGLDIYLSDFISIRFPSYTLSTFARRISYCSYEKLMSILEEGVLDFSNEDYTVSVSSIDYKSSLIAIKHKDDIKLVFGLDDYLSTKMSDEYIIISSSNLTFLVSTDNWGWMLI